MATNLINQLGEWNPQLFRELKGRLRPRNVIFTAVGSLVFQSLLLLTAYREYNSDTGSFTPGDWHIQWSVIFEFLSWGLPLILMVGGVHLIVSDLAKEEYQGTLNFIRLTPQPSQSILLGKVLGVPALLYLGVASIVPLHWLSAISEGMSISWVLALETLWVAGSCLFYGYALLLTSLGVSRDQSRSLAWVCSLLACTLGMTYISLLNAIFTNGLSWDEWSWFYLPLGTQPVLTYGFTLLTLGCLTYWSWQAVNRRFRNQNIGILGKEESYWLVGSTQLWLLGFAIPQTWASSADPDLTLGFVFLFILSPLGFLLLIPILSPQAQTLREWARYRRLGTRKSSSSEFSVLSSELAISTQNSNLKNQNSLMRDLIFGERSPALVAIGINLLITAVVWMPWILLWHQDVWTKEFKAVHGLVGWFMTMNVILIFAAIAELMPLLKVYMRILFVSALLAVIFFLPAIFLSLSLTPEKAPALWFFSVFPVAAVAYAPAITTFFALLGQLSVLGLLSLQLTRQLRKVGESASKELFLASSRKN